jgi:hypothetical protein
MLAGIGLIRHGEITPSFISCPVIFAAAFASRQINPSIFVAVLAFIRMM